MGIELTIQEGMAARPDAVAVACMDTRSGLLLGVHIRGDVPRDDVEIAALSATQLCCVPQVESSTEGDEEGDESFIASARWIHAYARVRSRRDLVVVGLAPGDANVALLRSWIRQIAERVGTQA